MSASAVPSVSRYVTAAGTGARRIDRSPAVVPQSFEPTTSCWSSHGRWPRCDQAAIRCWRYRGAGLGAKTVLSKLLRAPVDPNVAAIRALPREERELMIAASNGHVLAFDNLSGLSPWLSDALCWLASGGSFAVRRFF